MLIELIFEYPSKRQWLLMNLISLDRLKGPSALKAIEFMPCGLLEFRPVWVAV
jgi:hypothetical protein